MRRAPKRDANEPEIVAALRLVGCRVVQIDGKGVPDLLVWSPFHLLLCLLEDDQGKRVEGSTDKELNEAVPGDAKAEMARFFNAVKRIGVH